MSQRFTDVNITLDIPFLGELIPSQRRLLEAVMTAHQRAAVDNANVSTGVFLNSVAGSGSFRQSVCAGILSAGGPHAPISQARAVFEQGTVEAITKAIADGEKVPGFGNSFFKGRCDLAWAQVMELIEKDFPLEFSRLVELTVPFVPKGVFPNAAMFTAIACHICHIPAGLEDSLFILARVPAWASKTVPAPEPVENSVFQIVGLPRSGTAFLSVMFSLADECCVFHELSATDHGWKNTLSKARSTHRFVADCSTYGFLPGALIADSRKVFVSRPWEDSRIAAEAAMKMAIDKESYARLNAMAQHWADEWHALRVDYSSLWNIGTLRLIWGHCFEGFVEFPERKVEHLLTMNVQRMHPERVFGKDAFAGREHELNGLWVSEH